jgi:predicted Zn-dependent protease
MRKQEYVSQIEYYLKNSNYEKAQALVGEMAKNYPNDAVTHYLKAKIHFLKKDYEAALEEGKMTCKFCRTRNDKIKCAILLASTLFLLSRYKKAYEILLRFKDEKDAEIKELLIFVCLALGKEDEARNFYKELFTINQTMAEKLFMKLVS